MVKDNTQSVEYWNKRALKNGHTGFSDSFIYCFDQQARLYAIEYLLKQDKLNGSVALDFGCGSGDFSFLLKRYFENLVGFDISESVLDQAQKKDVRKSILFSNQKKDIEIKHYFDLILSVTVLQSFEKKDFEETINLFANILKPNGTIICMEFFATTAFNSLNKSYKITTTEWHEVLRANYLCVKQTHDFYNPVEYPSQSWTKYNNSLFLKLLKPFKKLPIIKKTFFFFAKQLISKYEDIFLVKNNVYKIYVIQKSSNKNEVILQ